MLLTVSLCRTLEMMQDDVRTSGIDAFLVYNWFWCMKSCLWMFLDKNIEFMIHLHTANECLIVLDVDEIVENVFVIWMSFCMSFQHEQPACLKPNCMFYFWKLPHVFVTSFVCFANG